jgi:hypothetical protein
MGRDPDADIKEIPFVAHIGELERDPGSETGAFAAADCPKDGGSGGQRSIEYRFHAAPGTGSASAIHVSS